MKVTFILHSCYHVELEGCCLLFDYYEGEVPESDKPLYVFASHSHEDHFSPCSRKAARCGDAKLPRANASVHANNE